MFRTFCAIGAGLALWTSAVEAAAAETPEVVASIKAVHSLVAGVMAGVGEPTLLVKGGASPHTYALRPSEAAALQRADVVFWIGAEMETFLERPLAALPRSARAVALHEVPGVRLLAFREGDDWGTRAHDEGDELRHEGGKDQGQNHGDARDHQHARGAINMHLWLDPVNAMAVVEQIVATLSDADPANAASYEANGAAVRARLAELDVTLERELASIKDRSYIVFHDAYPYFDARYGLRPAGSITVSPERMPGAAKLFDVRKKILETGATCVFAEPEFRPAVVRTVIEGSGARIGVLDPMGADLEPGADAYFVLMRNLAKSLTACLKPTS